MLRGLFSWCRKLGVRPVNADGKIMEDTLIKNTMVIRLILLAAAAVGTITTASLCASNIFNVFWERPDWPLAASWYALLLPATTGVLSLGALFEATRTFYRGEPERLLDATPYVVLTALSSIGWASAVYVDTSVAYAVGTGFLGAAVVGAVAVHMSARAWRNGRHVVLVDAFASSLVVTTAFGTCVMGVATAQAMPNDALFKSTLLEHVSIHLPTALLTTLVVLHSRDPLLPLLAAASVASLESWTVLAVAAPLYLVLSGYAIVKRTV